MPPRRCVADRLAEAGWTILARNVHVGRHELDLVAVDPGPPPALVVVEVRWRAGRDFGLPEETVDHRKRARVRAAAYGLLDRGSLPDGEPLPRLPLRFDLVVVEPGGEPRSGIIGDAIVDDDRAAIARLTDPEAGPVLHSRPVRGHDPEPPDRSDRPRQQAWSSHADRSDRDGAGRATQPTGPRRRGPRRNEPTGGRHRAVRFDAAAARGRSPLRPPDPPLESQDEAVHLRGAQRDPHHRPGPDRPAPGRRPRVRPRDRRPRRPGPVRRHQEAGPGAGRPGGDPRRHALRQQALAGRHAHQLRDDQEADRPARAARGPPGRTATSSG